MATTTLDAATREQGCAIPVDEVPAKLRCGSCNKIAVDAVKLLCCDQAICEPCSQDLPDTCPICGHSPLSSGDCRPNTKLRTTVKAFIKQYQMKKRKEAEPTPLSAELVAAMSKVSETQAPQLTQETEATVNASDNTEGLNNGAKVPADEKEGSAQGVRLIDTPKDQIPVDGGASDVDVDEEEEEDEDDYVIITTELPKHEQQPQQRQPQVVEQSAHIQEQSQTQHQTNVAQDSGFDQNQQNFGDMSFGDMNNFNSMMAMQNGMGMPNFGMMPSMFGMSGMNMDPSMMFGGGFGGMGGIGGMGGMNDMSMWNAGMNGGGMGGFGGMPNMNIGGGGPGFYPGNGGYNHQNFGNQMNQPFHHNNRYGRSNYRGGFARGRGGGYGNYGRGRGGWQGYGQYTHGQNQNATNQPYQQQQYNYQGRDDGYNASAQQNIGRGSPSYEPVKGHDGPTNNGNAESHMELANDTNNPEGGNTNETGESTAEVQTHGEDVLPSSDQVDDEGTEDTMKGVTDREAAGEPANTNSTARGAAANGMPIDSVHGDGGTHDDTKDQDGHDQQGYGYGTGGRGGYRDARGAFRGRGDGGAYGYTATAFAPEPGPAPAPPANAPTGPKAMREGLPNSGWYSRPAQPSVPASLPQPAADLPKPSERDERATSESRSGSRSQYNDRQEQRNLAGDDDGSEARRQDREICESRDRGTPNADNDQVRDDDMDGNEANQNRRSRSISRDEGYSGRRHRDRDNDRHSSRSRRDRSHERRKHRHRSRSPAREAHTNGEKSEYSRRKSERGRERDYDDVHKAKDHESRRKHSRRDDDYEYASKDRSNTSSRHARSSRDDGRVRDREREREKSRPVLEEPQDDIGFKIKGALKNAPLDTSMRPPPGPRPQRSDRRASTQDSAPATPSSPAVVDPYAKEREEAQKHRVRVERERLDKQSLGKRYSRDEDETDAPTGPKGDGDRAHGAKRSRKDGRRHSAKYEGEIEDGYDDRRRWR